MEDNTNNILCSMGSSAKSHIIRTLSLDEVRRIASISGFEGVNTTLNSGLATRKNIKKLAKLSIPSMINTMWVSITKLIIQKKKCVLWDFGTFELSKTESHTIILFEPGFVLKSGYPVPSGQAIDLLLPLWRFGPLDPDSGFPFHLVWKSSFLNSAETRYEQEENYFGSLQKKLRKSLSTAFEILKNPTDENGLKDFYEHMAKSVKKISIFDIYAHYISICAYWSYLSILQNALKPKTGISIRNMGILTRLECCKFSFSADQSLIKLIEANTEAPIKEENDAKKTG